MSDVPAGADLTLSAGALERVDQVRDRFEEAWRGIRRPALNHFVEDLDCPVGRILLRELLKVELAYRAKQGELPKAEEYQAIFPGQTEFVAALFAEAMDARKLGEVATTPSNSSARNAEPSPPSNTAAKPGSAVPTNEEHLTQTDPSFSSGQEEVEIPPFLRNHPRYRPIRVIGRGGMGEVFLAEHRVMGRNVVLKTIRIDCVSNPSLVERFLREVRACAKLSHPNIVAVYDAEHTADALFLAMEYREGEDLRALVQRIGPLDLSTACAIVRQATAGVAALSTATSNPATSC